MNISPLNALSPLDGRYQAACEPLAACFSEAALIRYRVWVEAEYLVALGRTLPDECLTLNENQIKIIRSIAENFTIEDAQWVKDKEKITNHDVKAVEYFVKEKLRQHEMEDVTEWVH